MINREPVAYEKGDLLIHTADGKEVTVIEVTRKSFSFEHTVVGKILGTTLENEFMQFAMEEDLEFQVLKKHCIKV